MSIKYADQAELGTIQWYRRPARRGMPPLCLAPGQSPSGYGDKISSDYVVQFDDKGRKYRVYIICHSNLGSMYVIVKGQRLYMRNEPTASEIPDE